MLNSKTYRRQLACGIVTAAIYLSNMRYISAEDKIALSNKEFRSFPVKKITTLTPNTRSYEIELPSAEHVLVSSKPNRR